MSNPNQSEQCRRYQSHMRTHLKGDEQDLSHGEQISILEKKKRKQNWFLGINIAAILFFGYSFYYNITRLSDSLMYILGAVFVINIVLILYQKKQLSELIQYLRSQ